MPMVNIVPRGLTACVDAYLTPLIRDYLTVEYVLSHNDVIITRVLHLVLKAILRMLIFHLCKVMED